MTMTDANSIFLDTNILLRLSIKTAPLHSVIDEYIAQKAGEGYRFWISRQIIREFLVQVSRTGSIVQQPLSLEQMQAFIATFNMVYQIADETKIVTDHLLTLLQEIPTGGKQIHDANIVATMLAYGVPNLITLNLEDMKRFTPKITLLSLPA